MQYFALPFRIIYKVYYFFVFIFSVIVFYPVFYYLLIKQKNFSKAFIVMRFQAFILLFFAGVPLYVKGIENIPNKGAFIICPNHSSFLDIFCLYRIFSRYFVFTGKKEIEKWPLFHIFYTSGMNILVDRHNKTGIIGILKRMSQEIDKGNPIAIFPEGTRSKDAPKLAPFKSGAFAIAIQKQIPILPITFVTNWKRLQRGGILKGKAGPGLAKVIIHKPITTIGLNKTDIHQLENVVKAIIGELL